MTGVKHGIGIVCAILAVMFAGIALSLSGGRPGAGAAAPGRKISPPVFVEVARVEQRRWQALKTISGIVKSARRIEIRTELPGRILTVGAAGLRVHEGQLLLHLDDLAQRAQLREKEAGLALARDDARRADLLLSIGGVAKTEQQAAQVTIARMRSEVETLRAILRKMNVTAPFDGVAGLHDLAVGQSVSAGQALFTFYDPSALFVEFSVPETDLGALRWGIEVGVGEAVSGWAGKAVVSLIDTEVNAVNRTVAVRARLAGAGRIRNGSGVTVSYPAAAPSVGLVVPEGAVMYSAYGESVFVVEGQRAKLRFITTGVRQDGFVQVHKGLDGGERVVTAGQMRLYPDAPVRTGGTT